MPWQADPNKKRTATCPQCGNEFSYYKCWPKEHCSRACFQAAKRTSAQCPTCGTSFVFHKSWPRIYCSRKCAGKATVSNMRSAPLPPVATRCIQCEKEFERPHGRESRRFCSLPCWQTWRSAQAALSPKPVKRPYGRPPHSLVCEQCGVVFFITAAQATATHGRERRFCSRSCWNARMTIVNAGPNSPSWKGGHPYGPSWFPARDAVRVRDVVCVDCGRAPKPHRALDVHHIVPFRSFGSRSHAKANALANLVALCLQCHIKREWATNRRKLFGSRQLA
jgi:hypothetical protein